MRREINIAYSQYSLINHWIIVYVNVLNWRIFMKGIDIERLFNIESISIYHFLFAIFEFLFIGLTRVVLEVEFFKIFWYYYWKSYFFITFRFSSVFLIFPMRSYNLSCWLVLEVLQILSYFVGYCWLITSLILVYSSFSKSLRSSKC